MAGKAKYLSALSQAEGVPVPGHRGLPSGEGVTGIAAYETTEKVVGARRLETLRRLGEQAVEADSFADACARATAVLSENKHDVPFARIYCLDGNGQLPADAIAPEALASVVQTRQPAELSGLELPGGAWPEPATQAVVLPLFSGTHETASGVIVLGVSPRRPLDGECRTFFSLAAGHVSTAMANARARQEERKRVETLAAMTRLHKIGELFVREGNLESVLGEIVEAAMAISGSDFGNIQLVDAGGAGLQIAAQRGFPQWWVNFWNKVTSGHGACGTALERGERVIVEDVEHNHIFVGTPALEAQLKAGVRAVQSTPLVSRSGKLLGMFSTHWKRPHKPDERALRLLDLLARQAADIIERARTEAALRESEELFRVMFTQSSVGKGQTDPATGRFLRVNAALCRITGYSEEELLKRSSSDITHPEDRAGDTERVRALVRGEVPGYDCEKRYVRPDGDIRWVHVTVNLIHDAEGRPLRCIGVIQDITARKEAEAVLARDKEELERLVAERTAKLEELVAELEHFSYTIVHDMRAPLRGMLGFSEMMAEAYRECREQEAQEFLKRIEVSASRMDRLITDALNYNKAVRQELPLEPVDVGALLRGMLDSYPELQRSGARVRLEGEIPLVLGNEAGLTQCFSNLLGNAVKFVKPGETPEIRIWAEMVQCPSARARKAVAGVSERAREGDQGPTDGRRGGEWVRIWVEDMGIGMPESMKAQVFDMFSRGHNSYEGTGIGLALVRKVVDRMGGRVGVESQEGKGSRFWVELKPGRLPPSLKPNHH